MPPIFADSGYWIALMHSNDQLHGRAVAMAKGLGSTRIVTTQMVLAEALNSMAGLGESRRRFAVEMVQRLQDDPDIEIVPQTNAQFETALERYASREDKECGVTDCASFLVMEERDITEALADDKDFEQAGFVALLRESS